MSVIFFLTSIRFMSHVDFKKRPCRPVGFKGLSTQHSRTVHIPGVVDKGRIHRGRTEVMVCSSKVEILKDVGDTSTESGGI